MMTGMIQTLMLSIVFMKFNFVVCRKLNISDNPPIKMGDIFLLFKKIVLELIYGKYIKKMLEKC